MRSEQQARRLACAPDSCRIAEWKTKATVQETQINRWVGHTGLSGNRRVVLGCLNEPTTGSHDLQYRVSDAREFAVITGFLKSLRKERLEPHDILRSRLIPSEVQEVAWERFERNGQECENPACPNRGRSYDQFAWHLDHTIPFSRGGSSVVPENLRVLCAECNLRKGNRFEAFTYYLD